MSAEGKAVPVVAVLPFAGMDATPGQSAKLTRCVALGMFDSDSFDVVEQRRMNRVSREPGFPRLDSCAADGCLVQAGRALGADQVFGGQVERRGDAWTVELRRLDVATGMLSSRRTLEVRGGFEDVLGTGCRELVASALDGSGRREARLSISTARGRKWPWVVGGLAVAGGVATTVFVLFRPDDHGRGPSEAAPSSPQMVVRW